MAHLEEYDPFLSMQAAGRPLHPANASVLQSQSQPQHQRQPTAGGAKVLAHNPFSTMGTDSSSIGVMGGGKLPSTPAAPQQLYSPPVMPGTQVCDTRPLYNAPSTAPQKQGIQEKQQPIFGEQQPRSQEKEQQQQQQQQQQQRQERHHLQDEQHLPPPPPPPPTTTTMQQSREQQTPLQAKREEQQQHSGCSAARETSSVLQTGREESGILTGLMGIRKPGTVHSADTVTASSRSPAVTLRAPSLGSFHSMLTSADKNHTATTPRKNSYFAHLLKKEPPEFLRPSSSIPWRERTPKGSRPHTPLDSLLSLPRGSGDAGVAVLSRSSSVGIDDEGRRRPQQQQQQQEEEPQNAHPQFRRLPAAASLPPSNEGKGHGSILSLTSDPVDGMAWNKTPASVPPTEPSEFPRILETQSAPFPSNSVNTAGTYETVLPSSSFVPTNTDVSSRSSTADERVMPPNFGGFWSASASGMLSHVPREAMSSATETGEAPFTFATPLNLRNEGSCSFHDIHNDSFGPPPRRNTAPPTELSEFGFSSNKTYTADDELTVPPPVPGVFANPAAVAASKVPSKHIRERPSFPVNMGIQMTHPGLHTPRNGGTGLRRSYATQPGERANEVMEESPAPFPPSRQGSQEANFAMHKHISMMNDELCVDSADREENTGGRVQAEDVDRMEPAFLEVDPAQKSSAAHLFSGELQENVETVADTRGSKAVEVSSQDGVGLTAASLAPPQPSLPPHPSATAQMTSEQPAVSQKDSGISSFVDDHCVSGAKLTTTTNPITKQQRPMRRPCFALCTSTGYVITIFNASQHGTSVLLRSTHIAEMFSGHVKKTSCSRHAEHYVKTLKTLASSPLASDVNSNLPLKNLQEVVQQLPEISPLLREVLLFMLRDSMPEWRTEGQKALIKILSATTKQVPMTSEKAPNYPLNLHPVQSSPKGLQKIQQLLCTGDREAAVEVALKHCLYSHAIIIAMMCSKKEYYMSVIRAVVGQELDPYSPLAHAYCMFNEMPLPPFVPPKPSVEQKTSFSESLENNNNNNSNDNDSNKSSYPIQDSWVQHAATLVANFTKGSTEGLIKLGDTLLDETMIEEAHCCFLLAHLTPMGSPPPGKEIQPNQQYVTDLLRIRLGILGGHYNPRASRVAFMSPRSTLLTDILDRIRRYIDNQMFPFSESGNRSQPRHGLPLFPERYRVAFRCMQVLWLQEVGMYEESRELMVSLRRAVSSPSPKLPQFTLNRLILHVMAPLDSSGEDGNILSVEGLGKNAPAKGPIVPPLSSALSSHPGGGLSASGPLPPPPSSHPGGGLIGPSREGHGSNTLLQRPQGVPGVAKVSALPPPSLSRLPTRKMSGDVSSMRSSLTSTHVPSISAPPPAPGGGSMFAEPPLSHGKEVTRGSNGSTTECTRSNDIKPESPGGLDVSDPKQVEEPKPSRGRSTQVQERGKSSNRSRSLEAFANFIFRRGRSQDSQNDEAKQMVIDTEKPPKFDPVTGRYLFEETEDEKKAAEMVRAGPPKPSSMKMKAPVDPTGSSSGGPQSVLRPPTGPTGMLHAGSNGPPRAQYVDMFNTS